MPVFAAADRNSSTKAADAESCIPSLAKADGTASIGSWGASRTEGKPTGHGTQMRVLPRLLSRSEFAAKFCAPRAVRARVGRPDASLSEAVVRPQSALAAD